METGENHAKQRPETNLTPPPVGSSDVELLEYLLQVELDRVEVARAIEKARETVFPETSVIIRDCLKLHDRIMELRDAANREGDDAFGPEDGNAEDDLLARLATGEV